MLAVHHYSSSLKHLVLVLLSFGLAACSSVGIDLASSNTPPPPRANTMEALVVRTTSIAHPGKPIAKPAIKPANKPLIIPARSSVEKTEKSAWCTYMSETAAADATVMRAPTISASINKDGNKAVGVNYDVVGIARAELLDAAAEAKCRRYMANAALNRMTVAAPNVLSRAGYRAKSSVISRRSRKLRAIKTLVRRELATGNLDRAQATKLLLASDTVMADGGKARSEAAKRQGLMPFDLNNLAQLSQQLLKAERDLTDINSNIRSADAVSVNLNGSWREAGNNAGALVPKSDFYGGVNVSIKLGALNPLRFSHERAAAQARLRAYRSEPGSVFWKLRELEVAQIRGRNGLAGTLRSLKASQAVAMRQKSSLPSNDPAFLAPRYGVEIKLIQLEAEIAGIRATLAQIDRNLGKLRQLQMRS